MKDSTLLQHFDWTLLTLHQSPATALQLNFKSFQQVKTIVGVPQSDLSPISTFLNRRSCPQVSVCSREFVSLTRSFDHRQDLRVRLWHHQSIRDQKCISPTARSSNMPCEKRPRSDSEADWYWRHIETTTIPISQDLRELIRADLKQYWYLTRLQESR